MSDPPCINASPSGGEDSENDDPLTFLWNQVLAVLETRLSKPTFEAHLKALQPCEILEEASETTLILRAPSPFTREWIQKRHVPGIESALAESLGHPVTVRLIATAHAPPNRKKNVCLSEISDPESYTGQYGRYIKQSPQKGHPRQRGATGRENECFRIF